MPQLVSVAMATYNGAPYLREQIDSIINQTYRPIEIVVSDDCSTDETVSILEEYSRRSLLRYVVNENRVGLVGNFQRAMTNCTGDYIALADQDDVWLPRKLEVLMNAIGECSLAYSDAYLMTASERVYSKSFLRYENLRPKSGHPFKDLLFRNFVAGCTSLMRSGLIEDALPIPETERFHDWWLALVAAAGGGIRYVDQPLVLYRRHAHNVTVAVNPEKMTLGAYLKRVGKRSRTQTQKFLDYKARLERLRNLSSIRGLSWRELVQIKRAERFFRSYLDSRFRPVAFAVALFGPVVRSPWKRTIKVIIGLVGALLG